MSAGVNNNETIGALAFSSTGDGSAPGLHDHPCRRHAISVLHRILAERAADLDLV